MKELIEYIERKIELCTELNMPLEKFAYSDVLKEIRCSYSELNENCVKYTDKDIEKAYKAGQSGKTFYKKDGTVILPDNYQGVDG